MSKNDIFNNKIFLLVVNFELFVLLRNGLSGFIFPPWQVIFLFFAVDPLIDFTQCCVCKLGAPRWAGVGWGCPEPLVGGMECAGGGHSGSFTSLKCTWIFVIGRRCIQVSVTGPAGVGAKPTEPHFVC